jgi:regulator of protease activity HflC (stomatin/prohibitin superfamily)
MARDRFRGDRDEPGGGPQSPVDLATLKKVMGSGLTWIAVAFLVFVVFLFMSIRIGRVKGEQVGMLLGKISGKITPIEQAGVTIYNGITSDFFLLDKTLQTLQMPGDPGETALKIKTVDGSDVYINLKVQYRIVPAMSDVVIMTSGPDDAFKRKWARDYARSICRNYLGELTTEECYDSAKREQKIALAQKEINARLNRFGISIDRIVIPQRPTFYKEYEEMIRKKKLADQAVLEEQSKALAAKQKQLALIVTATNEKKITIERFRGEMEKKVVKARADAERARKEADAYHTRVTIAAEARFYEMQKQAAGILARKKAEAQGIEELKKALEGEGGRNMVKFEYAKKLKDVTITGQPFTLQGRTDRFEHLSAPASRGRPRTR